MFERICHTHTALSKYSLELLNLLQLTIYCIKYPQDSFRIVPSTLFLSLAHLSLLLQILLMATNHQHFRQYLMPVLL